MTIPLRHIFIRSCLGATLLLGACDNIDEADRFIEVEKVHSQKVVLIEKFTGLACVNCPAGDDAIHSIQEAYPGQVVAVSMHPKPGIPEFNRKMGSFDLRTAQAEPYFRHYGITSMPYAVFDGIAGENSSTVAKWSSDVRELLAETPPVTITLTPAYDEASRTASVDYRVEVVDALPEGVSLLCWLTEDHITGPQKFSSGVNPDYEHNHVFRAVAPAAGSDQEATWGEVLAPEASPTGTLFQGACSVQLDEAWVPENCRLVVFVFRTASLKVLQAAITDVITPTE